MSETLTPGAQPAVVACTGLSKHFREGAEAVRVLDGVEFRCLVRFWLSCSLRSYNCPGK